MEPVERRFEDGYGTTARVTVYPDGGARLRMSGKRWPASERIDRTYRSYRGARIAMGRMGGYWKEVTGD